jgi:hypothetical protein
MAALLALALVHLLFSLTIVFALAMQEGMKHLPNHHD